MALFCMAPSAVAQSREDELRREVQVLRERLTQSDDRMLDLARRYDQEKKRLQNEKEKLLTEVARLRRDNAMLKAKADSLENLMKKGKKDKKGKKGDPLDTLTLNLNFDATPLTEVVQFLQDITALNYVIDKSVPDREAEVTLRLKDISLRNALKLIGEAADARFEWDPKAKVVVFRALRELR
jgi:type II secretory pathway component HofQ